MYISYTTGGVPVFAKDKAPGQGVAGEEGAGAVKSAGEERDVET